ncbi:MAG TPA: hypothetical protein VGY56_08395 [Verrucomicrobiae bacterium]|nr:hypothetical protein [Verrucomicrobiae bacterium]
MKTKIEKRQKTPEQILTAFCAEIRDFLREPVRTEDGQTKPRLYALLDRVCEKDPKAAIQLLGAYAFSKPAHRLEISITPGAAPAGDVGDDVRRL